MTEETMPYHSDLPCWPDFAFPNNQVDGLLPTCRVESWEKFVEVMREPNHNQTKREMVYRGQRGYDWELSSTLSREYAGGSIPSDIRAALLEEFRLAMRGRGPDLQVLEEEDIWAYGQHNGLRTPLLDWSKSPFVSLYFAFSEPDHAGDTKNTSRAIFCLDMSRLKDALGDLFFEPRTNDNARLVNQAGLFTLTPSGPENFESYIINQLTENSAIDFDGMPNAGIQGDSQTFLPDPDAKKLSEYICKIHVPNERRDECLSMLRKMNIHHGSLFPDAYGASNYCNEWLRRRIAEDTADKKREEEAKRAVKEPIRTDQSYAVELESDLRVSIQKLIGDVMGDSAPELSTLADWSSKIASAYEKNHSVDWPLRTNSIAKLKTELSRQLKLLGASEYTPTIADALIKLFEKDYTAHHNIDFKRGST